MRRVFASGAVLLGIFFTLAAGGTSQAEWLLRRLDRLDVQLSSLAIEKHIRVARPPVAELKETIVEVRHLAGRGLVLAALKELHDTEASLSGFAFMARGLPAHGKDLAAFKSAWNGQGREIEKWEKRRAKSPRRDLPVAIQALQEVASSRLYHYHQAALNYARVDTVDSGLFYLGNAAGQRDFVELCGAFPAWSQERRPEILGLEAALKELESDTVSLFKQPRFSNSRKMYALNAGLKEVRQLVKEGARAGALLQLLEARLQFRLLSASPPPGGRRPADLKREAADWHKKLSSEGRDHSIALLYLQECDGALAYAPVGPADWERARAILEDLLPLYFRLTREPHE